MKAAHIVNHLRAWMPTFTNYFTDELNIVSMTRLGAIITVTSATDHTLSIGDYVTTSGALNPVDISSLTSETNREIVRYGLQTNPAMKGQNMQDLGDKIAVVETAEDHDLTEGYEDYQKITITGANDAAYNGEHYLLKVPNRRKFMYLLDSLPPSPDPGASKKLLENLKYGFEGFHRVTSIIDSKIFTYITSFEKKLGVAAEGTIVARIKPRISGGVSIDRLIEAYTPQQDNKMYLFVVLNGSTANKDRSVTTDATLSKGKGETIQSLIISSFSVYVFTNVKSEIAALITRDKMQDIMVSLCASIVGYRFPPDFVTEPYSGAIFIGDDFYLYDTSKYVHEFNFEIQQYLVLDDIFNGQINVAFRDIDMTYKTYLNDFSDDTITGTFSLDDEEI